MRQGAVVPNATVKAREVSTGATRTAQSNAEGRFLFAQVNPGTYRISVDAEGFGVAESKPASVAVGQTLAVNFSLSPAAASQTVEVTAQTGAPEPGEPEHLNDAGKRRRSRNCRTPGRTLPYIAQFAQGALMNTRALKRRQGAGRIWQRRVQRAACHIEWLHPRWLRYKRSLARSEHRPLDKSRHWSRCSTRSDSQYQLFLGRSGTVCSRAGELLHQVGHQRISRRFV